MDFETPKTSIRLDAYEDCPHCKRPLLTLAEDVCAYCGKGLSEVFEDLPSVASALNELAWGWTTARLRAWAKPRPGQLGWALESGLWRNVSYFVQETLWLGWANLHASLKGRFCASGVASTEVQDIKVCGISPASGWVALRFRGTRIGFHRTGLSEDAVFSFVERWTLVPTGGAEDVSRCSACRAPVEITEQVCGYCGAPAKFEPGPWLLVDVRAEPPSPGERAFSPFEGYGGISP